MSTETPETRKPNPYQLRREALSRAITAWQEMDKRDTGTLEDCLMDEGLILLPRSTGHGKWIVESDGAPVPAPGSAWAAGPVDAETAADMFLTETSGDRLNERQIVVRPATDFELTADAFSALVGEGVLAVVTGSGDGR